MEKINYDSNSSSESEVDMYSKNRVYGGGPRGGRNVHPLETKVAVVAKLQDGKIPSTVASEMGIQVGLISQWWLQRNDIRAQYDQQVAALYGEEVLEDNISRKKDTIKKEKVKVAEEINPVKKKKKYRRVTGSKIIELLPRVKKSLGSISDESDEDEIYNKTETAENIGTDKIMQMSDKEESSDDERREPKRKVSKLKEDSSDDEIREPKRKVGRPKQDSSDDEVQEPETETDVQFSDNEESSDNERRETKKKLGRPKKYSSDNEIQEPRKKVGRHTEKSRELKTKLGRPNDDLSDDELIEPKKKKGRPRGSMSTASKNLINKEISNDKYEQEKTSVSMNKIKISIYFEQEFDMCVDIKHPKPYNIEPKEIKPQQSYLPNKTSPIKTSIRKRKKKSDLKARREGNLFKQCKDLYRVSFNPILKAASDKKNQSKTQVSTSKEVSPTPPREILNLAGKQIIISNDAINVPENNSESLTEEEPLNKQCILKKGNINLDSSNKDPEKIGSVKSELSTTGEYFEAEIKNQSLDHSSEDEPSLKIPKSDGTPGEYIETKMLTQSIDHSSEDELPLKIPDSDGTPGEYIETEMMNQSLDHSSDDEHSLKIPESNLVANENQSNFTLHEKEAELKDKSYSNCLSRSENLLKLTNLLKNKPKEVDDDSEKPSCPTPGPSSPPSSPEIEVLEIKEEKAYVNNSPNLLGLKPKQTRPSDHPQEEHLVGTSNKHWSQKQTYIPNVINPKLPLTISKKPGTAGGKRASSNATLAESNKPLNTAASPFSPIGGQPIQNVRHQGGVFEHLLNNMETPNKVPLRPINNVRMGLAPRPVLVPSPRPILVPNPRPILVPNPRPVLVPGNQMMVKNNIEHQNLTHGMKVGPFKPVVRSMLPSSPRPSAPGLPATVKGNDATTSTVTSKESELNTLGIANATQGRLSQSNIVQRPNPARPPLSHRGRGAPMIRPRFPVSPLVRGVARPRGSPAVRPIVPQRPVGVVGRPQLPISSPPLRNQLPTSSPAGVVGRPQLQISSPPLRSQLPTSSPLQTPSPAVSLQTPIPAIISNTPAEIDQSDGSAGTSKVIGSQMPRLPQNFMELSDTKKTVTLELSERQLAALKTLGIL